MSSNSQERQKQYNRRDSYKNKKLQELSQIYYCQCGKSYLCFPALYLHGRNKHQVKFSSKRTEYNSRVVNQNGKTIITYFLRELVPIKQEINQQIIIVQNNEQKWEQTKKIIQEYTESYSLEDGPISLQKRAIMDYLINYLQEVVLSAGEEYPLGIEDILHYFNDFVLNYIPAVTPALGENYIIVYDTVNVETELIRLWRWLKRRGLISCSLAYTYVLNRS